MKNLKGSCLNTNKNQRVEVVLLTAVAGSPPLYLFHFEPAWVSNLESSLVTAFPSALASALAASLASPLASAFFSSLASALAGSSSVLTSDASYVKASSFFCIVSPSDLPATGSSTST